MELSLHDLDEILAETGLSDEQIEPMPCCGFLARLGDTEFGENVFCSWGRCVDFVCVCGRVWASVQAMGCPCRRSS